MRLKRLSVPARTPPAGASPESHPPPATAPPAWATAAPASRQAGSSGSNRGTAPACCAALAKKRERTLRAVASVSWLPPSEFATQDGPYAVHNDWEARRTIRSRRCDYQQKSRPKAAIRTIKSLSGHQRLRCFRAPNASRPTRPEAIRMKPAPPTGTAWGGSGTTPNATPSAPLARSVISAATEVGLFEASR